MIISQPADLGHHVFVQRTAKRELLIFPSEVELKGWSCRSEFQPSAAPLLTIKQLLIINTVILTDSLKVCSVLLSGSSVTSPVAAWTSIKAPFYAPSRWSIRLISLFLRPSEPLPPTPPAENGWASGSPDTLLLKVPPTAYKSSSCPPEFRRQPAGNVLASPAQWRH